MRRHIAHLSLLMKSKVFLLVVILVSGAILTLESTVIARKSPLPPEHCLGRLKQVNRGFPLRFLTLKPSVSRCEPVDRLSVLWEGNAYHKEFAGAAIVDFIFWSGFSAVGLLGFKRYRQLRQK